MFYCVWGLLHKLFGAISTLIHPSDTQDCAPKNDNAALLDSIPTALKQRLKENRVLVPLFQIILLTPLRYIHGLTLPAMRLLMTTLTMILM